MKNKLTYKDFKIGQKVVCVGSEVYDKDKLYDVYLTMGKTYIITDLDFHFPDSICIKRDNGFEAFFPIEIFTYDLNEMRKNKLERILK